MVDLRRVEGRVSSVAHGFKEVKEEAMDISRDGSVKESLQTAKELYGSETHQVRMVAVFVMGFVSCKSAEAMQFLREQVSSDGSWQDQEILAQAFDQYCRDTGYEKALPTVKSWLGDERANVRRAVTEGLRIWNTKPYFKEHPEEAIQLLARLKDDQSEYVRRSVGNALRDISRRDKRLVAKELATWDTSHKDVAYTYDLASKFL